ncbi:MAG TPA: hypothetical protein VHY20_10840, partial [Pirellulales bacterium]|nr:hypothetical protein [Pirellulales bacterium]
DAILDKATAGDDFSSEFKKGFKEGAKGASDNFSKLLIKAVHENGRLAMLRVHKIDNRNRALLRLVHGGAVSYYDFPLAREGDGQVRAIDIYVLAQGDFVSQTMRATFEQAASENDRGLVARLVGQGNDMEKAAPLFRRIADAMRASDFPRALEAYNQLPPAVKKQKLAQTQHIAITQSLDEKEYMQAMDEYRTLFPNDPSIDLISIDYFTVAKRFDEAQICIDRVDTLVEDPYLDALRASLFLAAHKYDEAREAADRSIKRDPDEPFGYWVRTTVSLEEKRYDDTVRLLNTIRERFHVQFGDLTTIPEYAGFVQSPQYKEWLKPQPPQKNAKPDDTKTNK